MENQETQEKSIQDYLAILSRRKAAIIVTGLIVFILGLVTALVCHPLIDHQPPY